MLRFAMQRHDTPPDAARAVAPTRLSIVAADDREAQSGNGGEEQRSGRDRRSGADRRKKRSSFVERIGKARDRRARQRRSGKDRRSEN